MPPYTPYYLPGFSREEVAFLRRHMGHLALEEFVKLRKNPSAETVPVPYTLPLDRLPGYGDLTESARNAISAYGIKTVGDACRLAHRELSQINRLGREARAKLIAILKAAGRFPGELPRE